MMRKIKNNDEVVVISGKDKGKRGKVSRVLGEKVLVSGVNIVKRHQKPVPQRGTQGGILEKEAPIHISNVAIWNPNTSKADRVGFRVNGEGAKERFFKSTNETIVTKV
ncbi:50S ribosomal protein L24 [gamma proteobacterium HdN1]|nr:50S ribosomal protein L24 [gamma proteobacterium HdN1]